MSTQAAAVLILLGAAAGGVGAALSVAGAAGLLALTWVRVRERWVFQWLAIAARFAARRRTVRLGTLPAVLMTAAPGIRMSATHLSGRPAALLVDDHGMTVLLELAELPRLDELRLDPPLRVQLVLTGIPAPALRDSPATIQEDPATSRHGPDATRRGASAVTAGRAAPRHGRAPLTDDPIAPRHGRARLTDDPTGRGPATRADGPVAISYRALDRNTPLAHFRAILAVRAPRRGDEPEDELRRALVAAARTMLRGPGAPAAVPLDEGAAVRVITDLTHAQATAAARETWTSLRIGGSAQATFRCDARAGAGVSARLLTRLLHLPASATTLSLTTDPATLLIRLAAPGPAALESAAHALGRLLAGEGLTARRFDGEHLVGLAATLPLAMPPPEATPLSSEPVLPAIDHGLMLGRNRHGRPVLIRPFRPAPTSVALIGSPEFTQTIAFRALALGARVLVSTDRPALWSPLRHGLPDEEPLTVHPPDIRDIPAGTPRRPTLFIRDGGAGVAPDLPWVTTMTVLRRAEAARAAGADLVLVQPLTPEAAATLGAALALGDTAGLLCRMPPGMVAVVTPHAVRWVMLVPTSVEKVLIGQPARVVPALRNKQQISI